MGVWRFVSCHLTMALLILVMVLHFLPNAGFLPWGGLWMRMQSHSMLHSYYLAEKDVYREMGNNWNPDSPLVQAKVERRAKQYHDFFTYDEFGKKYVYTYDIDSFYWLRYARNLGMKGRYGDVQVEGRDFDRLVIAPLGVQVEHYSPHPYVLAWMYKVLRVFGLPFMEAVGLFPMIFVAGSIGLVFVLARLVHRPESAFFAALFFGVLGTGVGHTIWGNVDTDAYNLFFPLLVVVMFAGVLLFKGIRRYVAVALCAGVVALYSLFWIGWWFIFDVLLGALGGKLLYELYVSVRVRKLVPEVFDSLCLLALLVIFAGVFVSLVSGLQYFLSAFGSPVAYARQLSDVLYYDLWPNVYQTVQELKGVPFSLIIIGSGGFLIWAISVAGLIHTVWTRRNEPEGVLGVLLLLWLVAMVFATTKGLRFALLISAPLSIGFGTGVGKLLRVRLPLPQWLRYGGVCVGALSLMVASHQVQGSFGDVRTEEQYINDAWVVALEEVKQNSTADAIITTWWDYGHLIKYVADRPVTFDGGTQQTPISYWVARLLTTPSETEALNILRMLDCGSMNAFYAIENATRDSWRAFELLDKVLPMNDSDARTVLAQANASAAYPLVKCSPPEAFVLVSGDMVLKSHVWGGFGTWNVSRAVAAQLAGHPDAEKRIVQVLNWSQDQARQDLAIIQGTADMRDYVAQSVAFDGNIISCDANACGHLVLNLSSHTAYGSRTKQVYPVVHVVNNSLVVPNASDDVFLVVSPSGTGMLANRQLARSVFTRLYFFEGAGLRHFKLFTSVPSLTEKKIVAYRVEWYSELSK
ncbi:hypothetical protein HY490_00640 [Candidatus Woesearchaeota archaeon]|nr:hypothetical protein [Candidatus Woesearchaeota archaeon]